MFDYQRLVEAAIKKAIGEEQVLWERVAEIFDVNEQTARNLCRNTGYNPDMKESRRPAIDIDEKGNPVFQDKGALRRSTDEVVVGGIHGADLDVIEVDVVEVVD